MLTSTPLAGRLVAQMSAAARTRFSSDSEWARAAGLPKETLSRLRKQPSCDLRTLEALARSAGYVLAAVPSTAPPALHMPEKLDREYEDHLLDLAASGSADPEAWRAHGPAYFVGGLAVLLASARGFDRERYLRLAEALHPGISTAEAFAGWLERSPVRAARFLPMARRRKGLP
jgi:hypothetical protein